MTDSVGVSPFSVDQADLISEYVTLLTVSWCLFYFEQEDLIPEDVMLLDCWECLYLWVGKGSNKVEREQAQVLALVSGILICVCLCVHMCMLCVCMRMCLSMFVHVGQ